MQNDIDKVSEEIKELEHKLKKSGSSSNNKPCSDQKEENISILESDSCIRDIPKGAHIKIINKEETEKLISK